MILQVSIDDFLLIQDGLSMYKNDVYTSVDKKFRIYDLKERLGSAFSKQCFPMSKKEDEKDGFVG